MLATLSLAALVLALDLSSKHLIMSRMAPGETITILPRLLDFTYVRNPGAAYGMLAGGRWFLAAIALILVASALFLAPRLQRPWERAALGLLIGGALGNMLDRVRWGLVTDFVQIEPLPIFQVFNLADLAISAAVVVVASAWLLQRR